MIAAPSPSYLPYKSVAAALIFCLFFGPVGLLYASFWGGLSFIVLGAVIVHGKLFSLLVFLWVICCIWAVAAANSYNKKIWQRCLIQSAAPQ